jgi:hypothetical protein
MPKHQPYEYKLFCFLRKKHNYFNSSLLKIPKIFNSNFVFHNPPLLFHFLAIIAFL